MKRNVLILAGTWLLLTAAMFTWYPVLSLHLRSLGAGDGQVALCYTGMMLGYALPQLLGGVVSDRVGRKGPIVLSTVVLALGYLAAGLARQWQAVAATMFCVACLQAFQRPAIIALLAESGPAGQRGRAFGAYDFAYMLGSTVGPFAGALLLRVTGIPTLILATGVAVGLSVVLRAGLQDPGLQREATPGAAGHGGSAAAGWRTPLFAWYLLVAAASMLLQNMTLQGPFATLHAYDVQHLDNAGVNLLFAIGGLGAALASLVLGRLVERIGSARLLAVAALGHAAAMILWASLSAGVAGTAAFFVAYVLIEGLMVANSVLMVGLAGERGRGTAVGLVYTVGGLIGALAPALGEAARGRWGSPAPFWAAALIAIVVCAGLLRLAWLRRRAALHVA